MLAELEGHKIHYTKKGKGPCLVFLHGFLENLTIWDDFAETFSKHYTVVQIDLPGHGKTDVFGDNHTMSVMAGVVNTVLEKEGLQEVLITGHSMGGYVALEFAKQFGHKTKALCLFNSTALPDSKIKKEERNRVVKVLQRNAAIFIEEAVPNLFTKNNQVKLKPLIDELVTEAKQNPVKGIMACTLGMRDRADSLGFLKTIDFPVHYIIGRMDNILPFERYKDQLYASAYISAYVSAHSGHMGFIEDRNGTFDSLKNFAAVCFD